VTASRWLGFHRGDYRVLLMDVALHFGFLLGAMLALTPGAVAQPGAAAPSATVHYRSEELETDVGLRAVLDRIQRGTLPLRDQWPALVEETDE